MITKSSLELFFKKIVDIALENYDEFNTLDGKLGDGDDIDMEEHAISRAPRLILYTSGSTGMPKGTIIADRTFRKRAVSRY